MKIDVNGVKITLTKEQLAEIASQTSITADNITYESASKLLKENNINPDPNKLYSGDLLELITIICAINFIDNGYKECILDWNNKQQIKYLPIFEKSTSGWLLLYVCDPDWLSGGLGGLYYLTNKSAETISKRYLNTLYKTCLG